MSLSLLCMGNKYWVTENKEILTAIDAHRGVDLGNDVLLLAQFVPGTDLEETETETRG